MNKKFAVFLSTLFCCFLGGMALVSLILPKQTFSPMENRYLQKAPALTPERVMNGSFMTDAENYVSDHIAGRDLWVAMKAWNERLSGKQENNGVYFGTDGDTLFAQFTPPTDLEQRVGYVNQLADNVDVPVYFSLIPGKSTIWSHLLPANAPNADERGTLERAEALISDRVHWIDLEDDLAAVKEEYIFYRTDHHWTSLGAYYGFLAWADNMGKFPYPYNTAGMKTVSEDFQGTLQSRINVAWTKDRIQYFPETEKKSVSVTYDFADTADSLYAPEYLETKNQYGFFLNDNHAFIEIHTGYNPGKTLFVIKDSYANSMIPLLAAHYETIYVVDLRYFNGKLFQLMEQYEPEQGMDVLVLYDCIHFLEDFKFY